MARSNVRLMRRPTLRKRWPVGSYAELADHRKLAAQMVINGLDCAQLAREINAQFGTSTKPQVVSRQFLSRLRSGKAKRCTPALADRISAVMGLDTSMLFVLHGVHNGVGQNAA